MTEQEKCPKCGTCGVEMSLHHGGGLICGNCGHGMSWNAAWRQAQVRIAVLQSQLQQAQSREDALKAQVYQSLSVIETLAGSRDSYMQAASVAEEKLQQAQAACAAYADLPSVVRGVLEHMEDRPCFHDSDGDCGNWASCDQSCPVARLRTMVGFTWQNENGDLGPTPIQPKIAQPILDELERLREIVAAVASANEMYVCPACSHLGSYSDWAAHEGHTCVVCHETVYERRYWVGDSTHEAAEAAKEGK